MSKYYKIVNKWAVHLSPRNTYTLPNCNYCTVSAYRNGNGFSVVLDHYVKRNNEFVVVNYHNIGYARTVADVFDIARKYVKISKIYK